MREVDVFFWNIGFVGWEIIIVERLGFQKLGNFKVSLQQ